MVNSKIQIETWSDIVCPFCFVGKKNLDNVIQELGIQDQVEIIPRSFQLEPQFPKNTFEPSIKYLSAHKGYPEASVKAMCNDLTIQGQAMGITFDFDSAKMFNTHDAHRLVKWARTFALDNALNHALMQAYTCEGSDMSQTANLIAIAAKIGLDENKAKAVLTSSQYATSIEEDRALGLSLGLRGVPFYSINERHIIAGVQTKEEIKKVLKIALSDQEAYLSSPKASSCSIDGDCT